MLVSGFPARHRGADSIDRSGTLGWLLGALITIALPTAIFLTFYHWRILDPHNVGWLLRGTDNGENLIGSNAWWHDDARHGLRTTLLNAPEGVSILFTDSNPLWTVMMAPFAALMTPGVQFIGWWVLLCLVLQTVFARALLSRVALDAWSLWIGVAMMLLLPTLYARHPHANLQAHWVILAALWLFLDPRRAGDARWWTPLLVLTALIHNYLLLMVAAIWGSAMLERWIAGTGPDRRRLLTGAACSIAAVGFVMAQLGVARDVMNTHTYGVYGMPIDALWNATISVYSELLPTVRQQDYREFEGFQYLGVGMMMLIIAAPLILIQYRRTGDLTERWRWLLPMLAVMTALAVTHQIDFAGRTIFTLPLPRSVIGMLDPIRASARLFWPVSYALMLAAIMLAFRLPRRDRHLLLGATLALQLVDMSGMVGVVRGTTAEAAQDITYRRTVDPRWAAAIDEARDISFVPGDATAMLDLYQELAWRASIAGKPMRLVYAARPTRTTLARRKQEDAAFAAGTVQPDRLYVLMPGTKPPAAAIGRSAILDGVHVILPAR